MPTDSVSTSGGTTLGGRYDLGEVVGRGGMADVHRATDRVLHRPVAVKLLRETAQDDTDRVRFTAEARILAGLSHAGLVMVLDAGITSERPYLVMELVEGPTLRERCAGRALDSEVVAGVGAQVAAALAYAHARGVVHRDVKPANVLLGAGGRVKLADFGIARLIGDTVPHTRTGHAIGTAAYLAPEQVRGGEVTPAVDVYSLGLVLLEALTGDRAYPGPPTEAALARLSRAPQIPETLTPAWRRLLREMTAAEPALRPDAARVAAELGAEPTGALQRPGGDATATLLLPQLGGISPRGPVPSMIDRAAGALAHRAGAALSRVAALPSHVRGVAAAVLAIAVLVVIAALASGGDASTPGDEIPSRTPVDAGPLDPAAPTAAPTDRATDRATDKGSGKPKKPGHAGGPGKGHGRP